MLVSGKHYRTIWLENDGNPVVKTINQLLLPHKFEISELRSSDDVITAIKTMLLRGAPLIGVAAAYGIYLACVESAKSSDIKEFDKNVIAKSELIKSSRPTAVNLFNAVNKSLAVISNENSISAKIEAAHDYAEELAEKEILSCKKIGEYGLEIIKNLSNKKQNKVLNILTHCNAGWLACIDYGTATAPIYLAKKHGLDIHVWVEETRPRNQGANLTAWELGENNIPHTIITDNAGGYVMQKGLVDLVLVGSDRTTLRGDVCNKIGTYKTALAAKDNNIPFYAALPVTSFDFKMKDGLKEIPIEERNPDEVKYISGKFKDEIIEVLIAPENSPAKNYGFDITPSRLVTGLITDKGIIEPSESEIKKLMVD
jgi:methylthioribose-1-phosphate isomerase